MPSTERQSCLLYYTVSQNCRTMIYTDAQHTMVESEGSIQYMKQVVKYLIALVLLITNTVDS